MTTSLHTTLRVWDLPIRLFHWALAMCVIALIVTGTTGGVWMQWHMSLGFCVLALLLWRIVWGFVGGYYARFAQFLYSPLAIWRYLRGHKLPEHDVGHNPLGSLSVWALLGLLGIQVVTGLMSDDEIATQGPLVKYISNATVSLATFFHKQVGKRVLIALIVLHIAAIFYYLFKKRQNLIKPMLTGDKTLAFAASHTSTTIPTSADTKKQRLFAAVVFTLCAGLVFYLRQRLG